MGRLENEQLLDTMLEFWLCCSYEAVEENIVGKGENCLQMILSAW